MEVTELKKCLFIMPLDHPLKLTADYQNQTAQILSHKHQFSVLIYQAYEKQVRPWRLVSKNAFQELIKRKKNTLIVKPLHILPFERIGLIYSLNKKLSLFLWIIIAKLHFKSSWGLLWIFHPRYFEMVSILSKSFTKKRVVYDCLDYISSIKPDEEMLLRQGESYLFAKSDLVVYNSQFLADFHKQYSSKFVVSPSGFVTPPSVIKKINKRVGRPVIGFGGSINYRINFDLITEVCKKLPEYDFKFYGELYSAEEDELLQVTKKMNEFLSQRNVSLFQFLPRTKLYQEMIGWDAGIIPYNLEVPLNYYCKPLKLYEYFYFGLPVISTSIPSIAMYKDIVYFADTVDDWVNSIKSAVSKRQARNVLSYKKEQALKNTWENKIEFVFNNLN